MGPCGRDKRLGSNGDEVGGVWCKGMGWLDDKIVALPYRCDCHGRLDMDALDNG